MGLYRKLHVFLTQTIRYSGKPAQEEGPKCSCGATLVSGAKFCTQCGKPAASICSKCKVELQPGAKFCTNCGTKVLSLRLCPFEHALSKTQPASCPPLGCHTDRSREREVLRMLLHVEKIVFWLARCTQVEFLSTEENATPPFKS